MSLEMALYPLVFGDTSTADALRQIPCLHHCGKGTGNK